jgi:L-threonylcarbamoyladenylate synthase
MNSTERVPRESESGEPAIARAVATLRQGGLVAFPTETVYGLGADAENEAAVRHIFSVKGRPVSHPLIVHIAESADLTRWVQDVPPTAGRLAERFWPGPLTLILNRGPRISDAVTGGLPTVGIRVPNHHLTLAMLRSFAGAVAAPSANPFGRVSPTSAEHVRQDLGNSVDYILDGGPCSVGIESTIVDLTSDEPAILRPGGITAEQLEQALGHRVPERHGGAVRTPGQHASHYAPRATVIVVPPERMAAEAAERMAEGRRVVCLGSPTAMPAMRGIECLPLPGATADVARTLYETLREVDRRGFDIVLVSLPDERGLGAAIADRLLRAAGRGE